MITETSTTKGGNSSGSTLTTLTPEKTFTPAWCDLRKRRQLPPFTGLGLLIFASDSCQGCRMSGTEGTGATTLSMSTSCLAVAFWLTSSGPSPLASSSSQFSLYAFFIPASETEPWTLIWRKRTLILPFCKFAILLIFSYLRDLLYRTPEITKHFSDATIHVLDYDMEYVKGLPDPEKFPEYQNKVFSNLFQGTLSNCWFLIFRIL